MRARSFLHACAIGKKVSIEKTFFLDFYELQWKGEGENRGETVPQIMTQSPVRDTSSEPVKKKDRFPNFLFFFLLWPWEGMKIGYEKTVTCQKEGKGFFSFRHLQRMVGIEWYQCPFSTHRRVEFHGWRVLPSFVDWWRVSNRLESEPIAVVPSRWTRYREWIRGSFCRSWASACGSSWPLWWRCGIGKEKGVVVWLL